MTTGQWGLCKDCEWWQTEPEVKLTDTIMGLCTEEELQPYHLRVSGNSGCNHYAPGEPSRAAGSSATPPMAVPQR
jgi:hypothetical protein